MTVAVRTRAVTGEYDPGTILVWSNANRTEREAAVIRDTPGSDVRLTSLFCLVIDEDRLYYPPSGLPLPSMSTTCEWGCYEYSPAQMHLRMTEAGRTFEFVAGTYAPYTGTHVQAARATVEQHVRAYFYCRNAEYAASSQRRGTDHRVES